MLTKGGNARIDNILQTFGEIGFGDYLLLKEQFKKGGVSAGQSQGLDVALGVQASFCLA